MARFSVLSMIFLITTLLGLIFSTQFSLTGHAFSESFTNPGFWSVFTIISLALFLIVFLSGKKLEAILVATGSHEADRERAKKAAGYYHAHKEREPEVLISGSLDGKRGRRFVVSQPGHIYKDMRREGVPRDAFLFETESKNTAENVVYSAEVIRREGLKVVDVVSNPSHLWRFRFLFNKAKKEGLIDEDVKINYVPTKRSFLFEDARNAVYGVTSYLDYLLKWSGKPLKSVRRK